MTWSHQSSSVTCEAGIPLSSNHVLLPNDTWAGLSARNVGQGQDGKKLAQRDEKVYVLAAQLVYLLQRGEVHMVIATHTYMS